MASEGLILLTNDGELANELSHPRYGVEKTYHALVAGQIPLEALDALRAGAHLAEGFARPSRVRIRTTFKKSTLLEIVLCEGRNREVRRLLARVGHKVLKLKRVAIGGVKLADLEPGESRRLRPDELRQLREAVRRGRRPRRDDQQQHERREDAVSREHAAETRQASRRSRARQLRALRPGRKPHL